MSVRVRRRNTDIRATWSGWPYLSILLLSFFVGVLCGTVFAYFFSRNTELAEYLNQYCMLLQQGHLQLSFFSVLWDCFRWPICTAMLGVTALGIVGIPILFAVRGFLVSFSTAAFGLLLGLRGIAVAAVLFAVLALLALPILFILGCDGLRAACLHLPNAIPAAGKRCRIEIWLVCVGCLILSAAIQWTVIPVVLKVVCSQFSF